MGSEKVRMSELGKHKGSRIWFWRRRKFRDVANAFILDKSFIN